MHLLNVFKYISQNKTCLVISCFNKLSVYMHTYLIIGFCKVYLKKHAQFKLARKKFLLIIRTTEPRAIYVTLLIESDIQKNKIFEK